MPNHPTAPRVAAARAVNFVQTCTCGRTTAVVDHTCPLHGEPQPAVVTVFSAAADAVPEATGELRDQVVDVLDRYFEESDSRNVSSEDIATRIIALLAPQLAAARRTAFADAAAMLRRRGETKRIDGNMHAWNECEQCAMAVEQLATREAGQ